MAVPSSRIRVLRDVEPNAAGSHVVYWMIAARRTRFNFALDRAVEIARQLARPLVILEALRTGYPWASDRLHAFILEGMADNSARLAKTSVHHYPYVEPESGKGSGLLQALAEHACAVVTDDYPCFFLPRMVESAARKLAVRMEAVDGNGLLPLSFAEGRSFPTAYSFRRFMQKNLDRALADLPRVDSLARLTLPEAPAALGAIQKRYPVARLDELDSLLAKLPIDHEVARVAHTQGGPTAAQRCLNQFLAHGLASYSEGRNHPDRHAASGLSPWLHFGHIGSHEIFHALCAVESWDGVPRGDQRQGTREGFWGLSEGAEAFLDQLVTWREVSFNTAATLANYDKYESLPAWAKTTLDAHAADERPELYTLAQLERAQTRDPIWNAAHSELLRDGRMHNYMRMLWGKKILEWSKSPEQALGRLIHLNNKYALDGRDPNSYSGIFWTLGRYDRAWGERTIFGKIRYMSSDSARRKLRLRDYLAANGSPDGQLKLPR